MKLHKRAFHGFRNLRGIFLRVRMYNLRSSSTSSSSRKDCSSNSIVKSRGTLGFGVSAAALSVAGFRRLRFFFFPCDPASLRSSEISPLLDALEPAQSPRPEAAVSGICDGSGGAWGGAFPFRRRFSGIPAVLIVKSSRVLSASTRDCSVLWSS